MHGLRVVDAVDPMATMAAIREALSGTGGAVLPRAPQAKTVGELPQQVDTRIALVIETSGSTAKPKRVAVTSDAALAASAATETALGGPGQWLLALPAFYIAGISVLVRSIAAGTTPVVMDPHGFTARRFVDAVQQMEDAARFTSLVPAQLAVLVESPKAIESLRRFDRVLVGGQAVATPLFDRTRELGISVTQTYGSTETFGGCVHDGIAIGGAKVHIRAGEIELAGPMLADGYLDDPQRTDAAFVVKDGIRWYRTGDLGAIDNAILTVTGRLDDVIISGGVKVSLGEVEQFVRLNTALVDAVVIAEDNEKWGTVPLVFSTRQMPLSELRSLVANALGVAAAPHRVVTLAALPTLPSGKPDRVSLRGSVPR